MANLANKYRPKTFDELTEQSIIVEILKSICNQPQLEIRNFLFIGPAGCGKAQPLDSLVLTPDGFIEMRDVNVGTTVITHQGDLGKVVGVFPQGERPIFEITVDDGASIRVADNHLNLVCIDNDEQVVTTDALYTYFAGGHTLTIPSAKLTGWQVNAPQYSSHRTITDIHYVGKELCQCIYIDHPDHTYISDGFIPTHNTTLARCVANILNAGSGEPLEIDAASHNGVDSVREIIQQASTYPVGAKYKVFILDEVHAFSQQAWQMLLKTLEEGPAKSVFALCTTNPEKIPATILSRVQTFQLSKISLDGITDRLIHVIECENSEGRNITYNRDAVSFIAKMAQGGMRDALTLLDKALSYSTDITSENLMKALNLPEYNDYFALLSAYAKKDNVAITQIVNDVYNSGVNFIKWFEGFHSFVMNVVKYIFLQDIEATMIPSHYLDKISKYTTAHSIVCLRLANKLLKLTAELKTTQYLQEVALTYLCSIPKKGE